MSIKAKTPEEINLLILKKMSRIEKKLNQLIAAPADSPFTELMDYKAVQAFYNNCGASKARQIMREIGIVKTGHHCFVEKQKLVEYFNSKKTA